MYTRSSEANYTLCNSEKDDIFCDTRLTITAVQINHH
jgi:hypothetical protein